MAEQKRHREVPKERFLEGRTLPPAGNLQNSIQSDRTASHSASSNHEARGALLPARIPICPPGATRKVLSAELTWSITRFAAPGVANVSSWPAIASKLAFTFSSSAKSSPI